MLWDVSIRKEISGAGLFEVAYGIEHESASCASFRAIHPDVKVDALQTLYNEYIKERQPRNTQLFHLLYEHIDLTGEWEAIDVTTINDEFVSANDNLADGRGFFNWIRARVDDKTEHVQSKLQSEVDAAAVPVGCNVRQLVFIATKLHSNWRRLAGPREPLDYAIRLLKAIPSKPESALLTTLRSHFAGLVTTRSEFLKDSHALIEHLAEHAKTLGIDPGLDTPVVDASGSPTCLPITTPPTSPPNPRQSMTAADWLALVTCKCCNCVGCEGTSPATCSTFNTAIDISKLSPGKKARVLAGRAFVKQNPTHAAVVAKNLKSVTLTIVKKQKKPKEKGEQVTPIFDLPEMTGDDGVDMQTLIEWANESDGDEMLMAIFDGAADDNCELCVEATPVDETDAQLAAAASASKQAATAQQELADALERRRLEAMEAMQTELSALRVRVAAAEQKSAAPPSAAQAAITPSAECGRVHKERS